MPIIINVRRASGKRVKSKELRDYQSVAVLCRLWIEEEERGRGYGVFGCAGNEMEQACSDEIMPGGLRLPEQIKSFLA